MKLAPLPEHGRVVRPAWQRLFHRYSPVITPLRALGLVCDMETCGNQNLIYVDLPDGSHLSFASDEALPWHLEEVTSWRVMHGHEDNPTVDTLIYDSTEDGEQAANGSALAPMLDKAIGWVLDRYLEVAASISAFPDRPTKCHCVIAHPVTPQERNDVESGIEYCRRINDLQGLHIGLAQLTGHCPVKREPQESNTFELRRRDYPGTSNPNPGMVSGPFDNRRAVVAEYGRHTHALREAGWTLLHERGDRWPLTIWQQGDWLHLALLAPASDAAPTS